MKDTFYDGEFGMVAVRRIANAKFIRIRVDAVGSLLVTAPKRARLSEVTALIQRSRQQLRGLLGEHGNRHPAWRHGSRIGDRHSLEIIADERITSIKSFARQGVISVRHPQLATPETIQASVQAAIKKALKREAQAYLPQRLRALADQHGFAYERLRFSTANGRWGSCSSSGTISLNIWLMSLSDELIDYVLIHELAHTEQMNHSRDFWQLVARCLPGYERLKQQLANHSPRN